MKWRRRSRFEDRGSKLDKHDTWFVRGLTNILSVPLKGHELIQLIKKSQLKGHEVIQLMKKSQLRGHELIQLIKKSQDR